MGRPPVYDWPVILEEVVEWLASGRTIRDYCRQEGKPTHELIYRWLAKQDDDIRSRIVRARAEGADAIAEEALAIADTPLEGVTVTVDKDGRKEVREDMLGHRKLQVETRLRFLAKWNSGRYGDRQTVEHTGAIGDGLTEQQRAQRVAEILRAAMGRTTATTQSDDVADGGANLPPNPGP